MEQVAIARVVLTNREHVIALEARDRGLMGMLLRYPFEVRESSEYFDDIQDVNITEDMLDLAKRIVKSKAGHFEPAKFEDHYEAALQELLEKKKKGQPIGATIKTASKNVYNLMDALRASIKGGKAPPDLKAKKTRKPSKSGLGRKVG
jgi:DNA end-binding protein Ku